MLCVGCLGDVYDPEDYIDENDNFASYNIVNNYLVKIAHEEYIACDISNPKESAIKESGETYGTYKTQLYGDTLYMFANNSLFAITIDADGHRLPVAISPFIPEILQEINTCNEYIIQDDLLLVLYTQATPECSPPEFLSELRVYNTAGLLSTIDFEDPKYVDYDNGLVFVSDDDQGLFIYDISEPISPTLVWSDPGARASSIYARNGVLLITEATTITQVDYSDTNSIRVLSTIDL